MEIIPQALAFKLERHLEVRVFILVVPDILKTEDKYALECVHLSLCTCMCVRVGDADRATS